MLEYPSQTHNHQTRKRVSDRSIETGAERSPSYARLTEKNLKAFEKMRGQTSKDQRSKLSRSEPKSSRSGTKLENAAESTTKTVPTTDSSFLRLAFENGILDPNKSIPHENLRSQQEQLDRARDTPSPTESGYKSFARRIRKAPNESTLVHQTSKLLKDYKQDWYDRVLNQAFNGFPKNLGFNNGLPVTRPDMVEGLEMAQFYPFPVSQELGGAAVPTLDRNPPTLPYLAGEWKQPGKDMILAETQAAYDSACMVYGRNQARLFLNNPDSAGHAYVRTFTTDSTNLNTFAHYSSETQGEVRYYQYPISSSLLISNYEDFKTSRRRLRNLQDNAKEASEKLRDELNKQWSDNQRLNEDDNDDGRVSYELVPPPTSASIRAKATDSTHCNGYEYGDGDDPNNQLLTEYWSSFSANNQDDANFHFE